MPSSAGGFFNNGGKKAPSLQKRFLIFFAVQLETAMRNISFFSVIIMEKK